MWRISFLLTISLFFSCAGPSVKEKQEGIPFVGSFEVHRYVLDNGLKVLVVEDDTSPTFAFQTWYTVGSVMEVPGKTGLAHLFEHMMFNKTKNLKKGEFDQRLEKAGVRGKNAFTTREATTYLQELPADKLELIIQLESERMQNLVVDEEAFRNEIKVVLNELAFRYDNNPNGKLFRKLFQTAFKKHQYRSPIGGFPKDLTAMTTTDATDFYQKYYSPNNATVVVVGDVDRDDVVSLLKKYYGRIPGREIQFPKIIEEPEQRRPRRKTLKLNLQNEKLVISYPIPGILHEDIPALEMVQGVLSDGHASRLNRSLVDTGIASAVFSGNYGLKNPSIFIFIATLQKGKRSTRAANVIYREIRNLSRKLVSKKELERAKNLSNFAFYNMLVSNVAKARYLGDSETKAGNFEKALALQKAVQKVTPEDIQRVVKKYLVANKRTVVRGIPK